MQLRCGISDIARMHVYCAELHVLRLAYIVHIAAGMGRPHASWTLQWALGGAHFCQLQLLSIQILGSYHILRV